MTDIKVGLIKGRHNLPVEEYIFDKIENVLDFEALRRRATQWVEDHCEIGRPVTLYVTGLTAATVAVVEACARQGVNITLMHYNASTGEYEPQELVW